MNQQALAYEAVNTATLTGKLDKATGKKCESCGEPAVDRHHEDYRDLINVQYLCKRCHAEKPKKHKDPRLLIKVSCTSRKFYLSPPPPGSNDWHVRFSPPRAVREKLRIRERVFRTTGCAQIAAAKHVARQIIESYWNASMVESVKKWGCAELGEIIECYRNGARTISDKEELAAVTITKNITSLIRIVETRFDDKGRQKRSIGSWEKFKANRLTAELLDDFKKGWLRGVDRSDLGALSSAKHTVNSYIRQARSLFADHYLPLYRDLDLPELTEFKKVRLFNTSGSTRYVPLPQAIIDRMEAEIRGLRTERSDLYLAFYFMLWLGMRVEEVCEARLEWIEEWPEQTRMAIVRRPYYKPKGIDGSVPIAPGLLADIRELSGAAVPLDHLIPGPNRRKAVGRELSAIVRRYVGPDRRKTCHELRKHAISMVLMRSRNYVDTLRFSRHADVRTLRNHYEGYLDDLAPITSSDWRAA